MKVMDRETGHYGFQFKSCLVVPCDQISYDHVTFSMLCQHNIVHPNLCRHKLVQQHVEQGGEGDVLALMHFRFPVERGEDIAEALGEDERKDIVFELGRILRASDGTSRIPNPGFQGFNIFFGHLLYGPDGQKASPMSILLDVREYRQEYSDRIRMMPWNVAAKLPVFRYKLLIIKAFKAAALLPNSKGFAIVFDKLR
jgi:hypothetical protein